LQPSRACTIVPGLNHSLVKRVIPSTFVVVEDHKAKSATSSSADAPKSPTSRRQSIITAFRTEKEQQRIERRMSVVATVSPQQKSSVLKEKVTQFKDGGSVVLVEGIVRNGDLFVPGRDMSTFDANFSEWVNVATRGKREAQTQVQWSYDNSEHTVTLDEIGVLRDADGKILLPGRQNNIRPATTQISYALCPRGTPYNPSLDFYEEIRCEKPMCNGRLRWNQQRCDICERARPADTNLIESLHPRRLLQRSHIQSSNTLRKMEAPDMDLSLTPAPRSPRSLQEEFERYRSFAKRESKVDKKTIARLALMPNQCPFGHGTVHHKPYPGYIHGQHPTICPNKCEPVEDQLEIDRSDPSAAIIRDAMEFMVMHALFLSLWALNFYEACFV
jgi:hypothetical protein